MNEYQGDVSHAEFLSDKLLAAIMRHGSCDSGVWADTVAQFTAEHPNPVDVGLVIGRFQPAHDGHIYLIRMALAASRNIVIAIGSANVSDKDNPFSVHQRELILKKKLTSHLIPADRFSVVHLNDSIGNDGRWFSETIKETGRVDAVFGNNGWVNGIFQQNGIPSIEIPLLARERLQGSSVRDGLRSEGFRI